MAALPTSMQHLIAELSKLPSIGEKTAIRLAYFLVTKGAPVAGALAEALNRAGSAVKLCGECFFFTEHANCQICTDNSRNRSTICVVEKPMDVLAIERLGEYRGLYHVLHGLWAPLRGQGRNNLKVDELLRRTESSPIDEVIIATSSTVEGDATALYIAKMLEGRGIRSSRLAQGMPKGGELEYADELTISRAFSGRIAVNGS